MRQIFDSSAARARTGIDRHCHADDLWDRHEPTEGAAFDYHRTQATRGDQRPTSSRDASVTQLNPLRATTRHPPMFFVPVPAPASIPNTGGRNSLGRCRVNSRHLSQETEAATCGKLPFCRSMVMAHARGKAAIPAEIWLRQVRPTADIRCVCKQNRRPTRVCGRQKPRPLCFLSFLTRCF